MNNIKFKRGSDEQYNNIASKDNDAIYTTTSGNTSKANKKPLGKTYQGDTLIGSSETDGLFLDADITVSPGAIDAGFVTAGTKFEKGTSITDILKQMWTSVLEPKTATQPTLTPPTYSLGSNTVTVEAGTIIPKLGTLYAPIGNSGAYASSWNGAPVQPPPSGVVWSNYNLTRKATGTTFIDKLGAFTTLKTNESLSAHDDTGKTDIIVGDGVNTISYEGGAAYSAATNRPINSDGSEYSGSTTNKLITAGTRNFTNVSKTWNGFRKYFYGASDTTGNNVEFIKSLTNSSAAVGTNPFDIDIIPTTKQVTIAYPASYGDIKLIFSKSSNANVTGEFTKSTLDISGANDYSPISYNVYTYVFSGGSGGSDTYQITI